MYSQSAASRTASSAVLLCSLLTRLTHSAGAAVCLSIYLADCRHRGTVQLAVATFQLHEAGCLLWCDAVCCVIQQVRAHRPSGPTSETDNSPLYVYMCV